MYKNKKILAFIPARGGSKGLPHKNRLLFLKKPLIAWTIGEAKKSKYIDRLILSSDDKEIIRISRSFGCEVPFIRPANLSGDRVNTVDVVLHAIKRLPGYDYILLLQPTSPLRSVIDIDGCIKKCMDNSTRSCVSVYKPKINPYWMYRVNSEGYLKAFVRGGKRYCRRQTLPEVYALNGAVYFIETDWLIKNKSFITPRTLAFKMPEQRSLDIDTAFDFKIAQSLMKVNSDP